MAINTQKEVRLDVIEYEESLRSQKIGIKEDLEEREEQDTMSALADRTLNLLARTIVKLHQLTPHDNL